MRRLSLFVATAMILTATLARTSTAQQGENCPGVDCPGGAEVDVLPSGPIEGPGTSRPADPGSGSGGDSNADGDTGGSSVPVPERWNTTLAGGVRAQCITATGLCTRARAGGPGGGTTLLVTCSLTGADGVPPCEFDEGDDPGNLGAYGWNLPGLQAWVCVDRWEVVTAGGTQSVAPLGCAGSQRVTAPVVCDGQSHDVTVRVYLRLDGPGAGLYALENPGPFESSSWTQTACEPSADQPPVLSWPEDDAGNEHLWSADGAPYEYGFELSVTGGYRVETTWGGFDALTVPNYPETDWDLEEHAGDAGFTLWLYRASDDPEAPNSRGPYRLEASGSYTVTWAELGQTTITSAGCSQVTEVRPYPAITDPATGAPIEVEWRTVEDCTPAASVSLTTVVAVNTETRVVTSSVEIGGVRPRITD